MLNLLPKEYRNKIRREYLRRFFSVLFIFLSFVMVFFIVSIFPSYTLMQVRKEIAENTNNNLKNSDIVKDKNILLNNIKDLESRMKSVSNLPGDKPTDFIDKALEFGGKGIVIKNITYTKKDNSKKEITLDGVAKTRADLISFSKRVKSSAWVTSSDIPLSNLASDRDILFFVTLTATSTSK